ncbi:hypothetical protein [Romboutsia sp. 1001713B170207_170306_H8]|uniref:hypothetical protein n=1 Tax=Romboutsia sp. 1001713B170207_170306_H8 TaxID=2787112 RepID=UPI000820A77D|nr:hypothetical protein [Romboutsia sp. 1001713B170207_170306_H8]SCH64768.1 Uncharacterised protein [uncultured Clostridium sp.]
MTEEVKVNNIVDIINDRDLRLCVKENELNINIPKEILESKLHLLSDYIRIYSNIEQLKENINKYIFDENCLISIDQICKDIISIKSEENLNHVQAYIKSDITNIEAKFRTLCAALLINIDEINKIKEEQISNYINNTYDRTHIVDKDYVKDIIDYIKSENMYSLKEKSRYGMISSEYNLNSREDILDYNNEEINGEYSPILVIYKPAKYLRGKYILDDANYIYIKRQPLDALINQEKLEDKGIDSMGAITYLKLKHNLTNENLQEILAEIYVYGQRNDIKFENIKLADITSNKVWMTADKLKAEFKELRYYHKNLTQRVKDIYDSTGEYYTQIGGKYIFNSRAFMHSYKTFKNKDIATK